MKHEEPHARGRRRCWREQMVAMLPACRDSAMPRRPGLKQFRGRRNPAGRGRGGAPVPLLVVQAVGFAVLRLLRMASNY
jgi:hypothetical protein